MGRMQLAGLYQRLPLATPLVHVLGVLVAFKPRDVPEIESARA